MSMAQGQTQVQELMHLNEYARQKMKELLSSLAEFFRKRGLNVVEGDDEVFVILRNFDDEIRFFNAYDDFHLNDVFSTMLDEIRRKAAELNLNVKIYELISRYFAFAICNDNNHCYHCYKIHEENEERGHDYGHVFKLIESNDVWDCF